MKDDGKCFWSKIKNCGYGSDVTLFTDIDINKIQFKFSPYNYDAITIGF
jgi:hypothetical protein